jgi:hypothetical protein
LSYTLVILELYSIYTLVIRATLGAVNTVFDNMDIVFIKYLKW